MKEKGDEGIAKAKVKQPMKKKERRRENELKERNSEGGN